VVILEKNSDGYGAKDGSLPSGVTFEDFDAWIFGAQFPISNLAISSNVKEPDLAIGSTSNDL
jgi:hypothetical protein